MSRPFPRARAHGTLQEIFPDIFFVTGTIAMPGPLPVTFSRNMTVVRQGTSLTLVNSLRLDEAGLAALDRLGTVENVIRLAGFHGMDDPFYKDRYGAKVWAIKGQLYTAGFKPPRPEDSYFQPDQLIDATSELPIRGARAYLFSTTPPEALLLLPQHGGVLISGDCLQNWAQPDAYFSFLGRLMMKAMGFIKPHNLGPGWLRAAKPKAAEIRGLLDLPFSHVLPAHGAVVLNNARDAYRPAIERFG